MEMSCVFFEIRTVVFFIKYYLDDDGNNDRIQVTDDIEKYAIRMVKLILCFQKYELKLIENFTFIGVKAARS